MQHATWPRKRMSCACATDNEKRRRHKMLGLFCLLCKVMLKQMQEKQRGNNSSTCGVEPSRLVCWNLICLEIASRCARPNDCLFTVETSRYLQCQYGRPRPTRSNMWHVCSQWLPGQSIQCIGFSGNADLSWSRRTSVQIAMLPSFGSALPLGFALKVVHASTN